jgi:homoserine dehydrogenase
VPQIRYDSGLKFIGEGTSKYYVRMTVTDKPGVLGRITTTFGQFGVSVEAVQQDIPHESDGERVASLYFRIFEVERPLLYYVLNKILKENIIKSIDNIMRIED